MGEAFITRGYSGSSNGGSGITGNFVTELITQNTLWKVPENLKNGTVSVRLFGGGGSGIYEYGRAGGGGFMNNAIINIANQSEIYITIGKGGAGIGQSIHNRYGAGGTTSFGTFLYASGAGNVGASGGFNSIGVQFGGGGSYGAASSYGGKWGGGGGYTNTKYGNGRGGALWDDGFGLPSSYSGLAGNGGSDSENPTNGTNTINKGLDFEGNGRYGMAPNNNKLCYCGGGGYGGIGGYYYGGGGGYGGNGGNRYGGGGGYGGDGGDGTAGLTFNNNIVFGGTVVRYNTIYGGGGGYGKYGKGAGWDAANETFIPAGIAAGGAYIESYGTTSGGDGICIIQYYIK